MIPDSQFIKDLKEMDEKLNAGWNDRLERWQIVRDDRKFKFIGIMDGKPLLNAFTKLYLVFTVKNEDGSYRPLDIRVIDKLREIDTYNKERTSLMMAAIEKEEDDYKARQNRRQDEMIHDITMENMHKLQDGAEELRSLR